MGTEYWLLSPRTKESFYLGKNRWYQMDKLNYCHAEEPDYECTKDVMVDIIEADCWDCEDTLGYLLELAHEIFQFTLRGPVQLVNDCMDDFEELMEGVTEVKDIIEITESYYSRR